MLGVFIVKRATAIINKNTVIEGIERVPSDIGGMLITSNHFGPLENTVIRHLMNKLGRKKLGIISQTENFAMRGFIGFIMNYADTIPISAEPRYLARDFLSVLKERLVNKKDAVLLYPEQEMWWNYSTLFFVERFYYKRLRNCGRNVVFYEFRYRKSRSGK